VIRRFADFHIVTRERPIHPHSRGAVEFTRQPQARLEQLARAEDLRLAHIEVVILTKSPGLATRMADRFFERLRKMPAARNEYLIERGLRTPTRDGFVLLSDHAGGRR
jgi:hypothetical protein